MRVLVAHPVPAVSHRVAGVLAAAGWPSAQVHSTAEALEACRRKQPDVVIVAAQVADELVPEIKRDPEMFTSAVVILGGSGTIDEALAGFRRGVHTYVGEEWMPGELLGAVQSALKLKIAQEELLSQARATEELIYADALTGLYNRRFLQRELAALVATARRHRRELSVVLVDVDHFKAINDTLGHLLGDRVLVEVADRLRGRLRESDYLGRFGGEEFLALLPDTPPESASVVAEALRAVIDATPITALDESVQVTVSAGWATWAGQTAEELVAIADQALYSAKEAGRNQVKPPFRPAASVSRPPG